MFVLRYDNSMRNIHLILMAHGSKDPRWRKSFEEFEKNVVNELGEKKVSLCYMEFIEPRLEAVIDAEVKKGINDFKVFPLFMSGGGHVDRDIPNQVESIKNKHSNINIEILPAIGENSLVLDAMKKVVMNEIAK